MSDITPNEPVQPVPEAPAPWSQEPSSPDVLADVNRPVGSSYDPMPLQVSTAKDNNWMGIVALITGIIGLSVVAIVFGILGLSAAKKGKATNRGMSIAGIILGAIWIVISAVAIGAFFFLVANGTSESMANAKVGDCYVSTTANDDSVDGAGLAFGNCETDNAEVFYVGTYDGSVLPSDDSFMDTVAAEVCVSDVALASLDEEIVANYKLELFVPNADAWDTDPHTVVCAVSTDGGPVDPDAITE